MNCLVLSCLLLAVCITTTVVCSPVITTSPSDNGIRCVNENECPSLMCCVHNPLTRPQNRRFIFEEFSQHDHGYCRYERKFNETCFPLGHDFQNADLYEFHCPCVSGLECRGTKVHETQHTIVHENPVCQTVE